MRFLSQPRALVLTERQPHIVRLAPGEVAFLLEHHRGQVEVLPTGRRDRYRLTPLGCVGVLVTPTCRFVIRPKIPLVNVFAMLDPFAALPADSDQITPETGTEAFTFLAGQLALRMAERSAAGLHRAYRKQSAQGAVLHGQLDLPAQLRDAPGRKDRLHSQYDDLSADIPCNRIVKTTAEAVLASPLLGADVRTALRQALTSFESISSTPLSVRLWDALEAERLPAEYRPLLELCRLLADGLTLNDAAGNMPAPGFLLDLERIFERHVARGIVEAFAQSSTLSVAVQETQKVNEPAPDQSDVTIRPDMTIQRGGRTVLVIDAKWKRLPKQPETADLYQILAYGATLGAEGAVLVYPGKRWSVREYRFPLTSLRLMICTLQVGGTRLACVRSVRRLARALDNLIA